VKVRPHWRGFSLLELLVTLCIGLLLIAAFIGVLQHSRQDFASNQSLARLQDSARHALGVLVADIEHAGFFGNSPGQRWRLVRGGDVLAEEQALLQPSAERAVTPAAGLPAGAHACGSNFAVDLSRIIQGSDNSFALGRDARDCAPTASAGGASGRADTLTVRYASLAAAAPREGRLQLYSAALAASAPLLLFADGRAPGPLDALHEVRDLEVRTYYIANHSVDRPGWPALRAKSLTESRGAVQFRDEEVMPGVEDLQIQFGVAHREDGREVLRYVSADSPFARTGRVVAVRLWLRIRADVTEPGFRDHRNLTYANTSFTPTPAEARQRRLLIERTVALRNARPA
jgi:type IV pilus assembly protein PilW